MKLRQFAAVVTPCSGFTLIELMITLGIAAILAAIAIPMYQKQVQQSRRTDARTAVLDLAGREERYLSVSASYTNVPANLGYAPVGSGNTFPVVVGSGYYQLTVTVPAVVAPNPPTYVVSSVPVAGSPQLKDLQCQYFSVDNTGKQFSSATGAGGTDTSSTCWQ
jgi:type IV pilus assembly protein PilE